MLPIAEVDRLLTALHIVKATSVAHVDDNEDVFLPEPMGHSGLKPIGVQMPCSMPASLSPTPVSRRNSGPVGPRQTAVTSAPIAIGDDSDDYRPAAGTRVQGHRRLDRCLSEPTSAASRNNNNGSSNGGSRNVVGNSSRYKTELCRAFEETGHCKYGEKCQFAHGHHELRTVNRHRKYKTELCRTYHTIGFCPYGPRCHFIHNAEEARLNKPSSAARPLSMSSSSSMTSSPTHSDSLSGSPTSSFSMFWLPGDEDRLQMESPPSFHANHHDLELFVASPKPTVTVEFPDIFGAPVTGPRLPVFSRLAATDADPADR